ncbi:MAG: hypothetical protein JO157_16985 [Acetobacteraceae bacterium]|nr:hypothetical protein [Acetobacteraceae bacterium]
MSRALTTVCATILVCGALPVLAQQTKTPPQPSGAQAAQQERMRGCNTNASARGFKGDARKTFMTACLSGSTDQKTIMKVCNAQASQDNKTGDARKSYMAVCLKSTS